MRAYFRRAGVSMAIFVIWVERTNVGGTPAPHRYEHDLLGVPVRLP
jgi:hypothetical protein